MAVLKLGVPEMDADHEAIEAMFARLDTTADAALAALFGEIEAEVRAHFAREEDLFEAAALPIAHCHKAQHALLLGEFDAVRPTVATAEPAALRRLIGEVLHELVAGHVASVDRVTSTYLIGDPAAPSFTGLRLPE